MSLLKRFPALQIRQRVCALESRLFKGAGRQDKLSHRRTCPLSPTKTERGYLWFKGRAGGPRD